MDLKLPDSTLRQYLQTDATPQEIAAALTACGPSVDRLHQKDNDWLYEIEVITNRVDSFSAFGVAREAAAILPFFNHKARLINDPYGIDSALLPDRQAKKLPLDVQILDKSLVKRFSLIILDNLRVSSSPKYIQEQLTLSGVRPINNLVDITNYLTLCFGQPLHVFDYDKILKSKMILRESKKDETITTLDHKTHKLLGGDIVIEDGQGRLIDLCGVMGGLLSEVDENTTRAVIFVQTYNPKKIRRTSLYTQERTLASQIFEKQPDTRLVSSTLIEATNLFIKHAGGRVASDSVDLYYDKPSRVSLSLDLKWLNDHAGFQFTTKVASSILKDLGFVVKTDKNILEVTVPTWRLHDISISEDLVEEITRVYGYFRLESNLPVSAYIDMRPDALLTNEYLTKNLLANLGFTEIINYSLVSKDIFTRSNLDLDQAVTLLNPLASEFEYMRPSLIPSLLMDLGHNEGKVVKSVRIFELSNLYQKTDKPLPLEQSTLCLSTSGLDFRTTKGYLETVLTKLGLQAKFQKIEPFGPFQKGSVASVVIQDQIVGTFGQIKKSVLNSFGISTDVYISQINFDLCSKLKGAEKSIIPPSEYPDIIEDVTIQSSQTIEKIIQNILKTNKLITKVIYLDSLNDKHTFRVLFNNPKGNLTQEEVNQIKTLISA